MAKKKAAAVPAVPPSPPAALLAGFHRACRDGDTSVLAIWADALEEAGDAAGAALLRQLPHAKGEMAAAVGGWCEEYPGQGEVSLHLSPDGGDEEAAYWFCGDCEMSDGGPMDVVGPLLARWDEFHPALEWLVRGLGLPFVRRHSLPKEKRREAQTAYRLASDDHFDPLPAGHSFCSLYCAQSGGTDGE